MQASGRDIAARVLAWYDAHARGLPWRAPPGEAPPEPYRVWLSEVMLQQTTVAHATPYFARFVARWPGVETLAAADEAEVMREWAGLGYYTRARNLIACARAVAKRGGFPDDEAGLRALPGVGAYTAAAIASIAFGRRAAPVDANIERVVARLHAIGAPLPGAKPAIRAAVEALVPARRAGDFAQALMDLGATVCKSRKPRCAACPLRGDCAGFASGEPERFPLKPAKAVKPKRSGKAFWIERGGAVWLVRRPPSGMLGGMRALPGDGWNARADGSATPPFPGVWRSAGSVRHAFTHFLLELEVDLCESGGYPALEGGEWWPLARFEQAGLPTLFAKAARVALAARQGEKAA